jgi:hypothetical protein
MIGDHLALMQAPECRQGESRLIGQHLADERRITMARTDQVKPQLRREFLSDFSANHRRFP